MTALIVFTDIVEKIILLSLLALSVWSLTIIIDRRRAFKKEADSDFFSDLKSLLEKNQIKEFQEKIRQHEGLLSGALKSALENSHSAESIDRAVSSYVKQDRLRLEKGLSVLGTLGANAPFIGLFGTVLGIIRAFAYLGSQSGSAAVMTGVSQALYATALGLFVAIPAVVFFNLFSKQTKDLISRCESLRDLYIAKKSDFSIANKADR